MVTLREHGQRGARPAYLTRFVGRAAELQALRHRIAIGFALAAPDLPGSRLITLTGVGGSGKTRLASAVVDTLSRGSDHDDTEPDQIWWVDLAPLVDPAQLARAVAVAAGVPESSRDPTAAVRMALRGARTLLVLDNCEELSRVCEQLAEDLLASCEHLVVLATSRMPLRLPGSHELVVAPLSGAVSGTGSSDRGRSEAAELFYDRASLVAPAYGQRDDDAETVELLCRRLDGVPLAIELAAPWIRVLSARDLLASTDRSLEMSAGSTPEQSSRHRSMRAVLDSSWRGLSPGERRVLRGLATFVGGFTLEAAVAVTGATLVDLSTLGERSLINRVPQVDGGTRYGMHEVVRQYAVERLAAQPESVRSHLRARHLDHFVGLAERARAAWEGEDERVWLDRLRQEDPNLTRALTWALDEGRSEAALRMCAAMFRLWIHAAPPQHYHDVVERALGLPWDQSSPTAVGARARTLHAAGYDAAEVGDFARGAGYFREAIALAQRIGDDDEQSACLRGYSYTQGRLGDHRAAERSARQSLALCRRVGDDVGVAWSLKHLAEEAFAQGRSGETKRLLAEAAAGFERLDNVFGLYCTAVFLGKVHLVDHEWSAAVDAYHQALTVRSRSSFAVDGGAILEGLTEVAAALRRPESAALLVGASQGEAWGRERQDEPAGTRRHGRETAQQQLGDRWDALVDAGRRLTPDEVLAVALEVATELVGAGRASLPAALTAREVDVIRLVAQGHGNSDVAQRLSLSKRTVDAHLRSIFGKLCVSSRTAMVHEATRSGLL